MMWLHKCCPIWLISSVVLFKRVQYKLTILHWRPSSTSAASSPHRTLPAIATSASSTTSFGRWHASSASHGSRRRWTTWASHPSSSHTRRWGWGGWIAPPTDKLIVKHRILITVPITDRITSSRDLQSSCHPIQRTYLQLYRWNEHLLHLSHASSQSGPCLVRGCHNLN